MFLQEKTGVGQGLWEATRPCHLCVPCQGPPSLSLTSRTPGVPPRMDLEQQRWRVAAGKRCEGRGHPLTAPQGVRPGLRPRKNVADPFRLRSLASRQ